MRYLRRTSQRFLFFGYAFVILGLALVVLSQVLPLIPMQQTMVLDGPKRALGESRPYWMDLYIVPPIRSGNMLHVSLNSSGASPIYAYVYSQTDLFHRANESIQPPVGNIVLRENETEACLAITIGRTDSYVVSVITYGASYRLVLSSVWPPFYWFKDDLWYGVVLTGLGVTLILIGREELMWERRVYGLKGQSR